jgi:hypothetical protein
MANLSIGAILLSVGLEPFDEILPESAMLEFGQSH